MRHLILTLFACLLSTTAAADWQLAPQGGWISDHPTARRTAQSGAYVLSLTCRKSEPFLFTMGYPAQAGAERTEAFEVDVDGQKFSPSGQHYPPDGLWTATPSAALITALKDGSAVRVTSPGATDLDHPIARLVPGNHRGAERLPGASHCQGDTFCRDRQDRAIRPDDRRGLRRGVFSRRRGRDRR